MSETIQNIKTIIVKVISMTLRSENEYIISGQEEKNQSRVHTFYIAKEESSQIALGDSLKITFEKVKK